MQSLLTKLKTYNQEHILQFWNEISESEQDNLAKQINELDLEYLMKSFQKCTESDSNSVDSIDEYLEPVPTNVFGCLASTDKETLTDYESSGIEEIAANRVACLLLAGGQGTRLGVNYPKGMYCVGLPSNKSLYHIMAQRILKLQRIANEKCNTNCIIPWYIMSSEQTSEPTKAYFKLNNYFGLDEKNVVIFEQNTIPCLTFDGKIIMESKSSIARSPDGNGGLYSAMSRHGILRDMEMRGVAMVHVHCVDNILVKMADPIFIGFCLSKKAQCAAKVVAKLSPTESVGVVCKMKGRYHVVEYSEISMETAQKRGKDGKLIFNAGGIGNHFFTLEFLKNIIECHNEKLKYHVAKKKIPYWDLSGQLITPKEVNGIKMEKFIFDVYEFSDAFAVWEVLREDEFSPVKNADAIGKDSPTTARLALFDLHHRWLLNAGAYITDIEGNNFHSIPSDACSDFNENNIKKRKLSQSSDSEESVIVCEISPLISYAGEGLDEIVKSKKLVPPIVLHASDEKTMSKLTS